MTERNETKAASFDSMLYKAIEDLIKERKEELDKNSPIPDLVTLGKTTFTNAAIRNCCKDDMDGTDIVDRPGAFWSPLEGIGTVTQTRITSTCKSRFKAEPRQVRLSDGNSRCIEFDEKAFKKVKSNYEIVKKIEIEPVSLVTDVTLPRIYPIYSAIMGGKISAISTISLENPNKIMEITETTFHNTDDSSNSPLQGDTSGTSATNGV